jgi:hypothetical protein
MLDYAPSYAKTSGEDRTPKTPNPSLHANSSKCTVLLRTGVFEEHVVQCYLRMPHGFIDTVDLRLITLHIPQAASELLDNRSELRIRGINHRCVNWRNYPQANIVRSVSFAPGLLRVL